MHKCPFSPFRDHTIHLHECAPLVMLWCSVKYKVLFFFKLQNQTNVEDLYNFFFWPYLWERARERFVPPSPPLYGKNKVRDLLNRQWQWGFCYSLSGHGSGFAATTAIASLCSLVGTTQKEEREIGNEGQRRKICSWGPSGKRKEGF
jgi:hypothetical protein